MRGVPARCKGAEVDVCVDNNNDNRWDTSHAWSYEGMEGSAGCGPQITAGFPIEIDLARPSAQACAAIPGVIITYGDTYLETLRKQHRLVEMITNQSFSVAPVCWANARTHHRPHRACCAVRQLGSWNVRRQRETNACYLRSVPLDTFPNALCQFHVSIRLLLTRP